VQIYWQTGAVTEGEVARPLPIGLRFRTPGGVVERIRKLEPTKRPSEIAAELTSEGLKTAQGKRFTAPRVSALLREWKHKEAQNKKSGGAKEPDVRAVDQEARDE